MIEVKHIWAYFFNLIKDGEMNRVNLNDSYRFNCDCEAGKVFDCIATSQINSFQNLAKLDHFEFCPMTYMPVFL